MSDNNVVNMNKAKTAPKKVRYRSHVIIIKYTPADKLWHWHFDYQVTRHVAGIGSTFTEAREKAKKHVDIVEGKHESDSNK